MREEETGRMKRLMYVSWLIEADGDVTNEVKRMPGISSKTLTEVKIMWMKMNKDMKLRIIRKMVPE